jgi:glycosyltransferase involved in cell wall biosynthesis
MRAVVVMPCLNEEAMLAATCASLGFGAGRNDSVGHYLILVDNGSEDRTTMEMQRIQSASPRGSVILESEPTRGYVPPRHRGAIRARELAAEIGVSETNFLLVQADADTIYAPGYIAAMVDAAEDQGRNVMLDGQASPPHDFVEKYPGFIKLSGTVDASVESLLCDEEHDVIVSDCIAAYPLSDYFAWGGHVQEYNSHGDEVHAETSRLYIRAKALGARRRHIANAAAQPSRRKAILDPMRFFVTAGFPRETSWVAAWNSAALGPNVLQAFENPSSDIIFKEAIDLRRRHLIALFGLLPAYLAQTLGVDSNEMVPALRELLAAMPCLTAEDISRNTTQVFEAIFALVDFHPALFENLWLGQSRP